MSKPAWSWQFEHDKLKRMSALGLRGPITKEWAWGASTGAGVKVAVVDSGIDAGHPAVGKVAGGVALAYDPDAEGEVTMTDGPHEDLFGHGTACAGIIRKAAPDVRLYSVRVLGSKLSGKGMVFAAGLRWAVDNGMQVVNLSLSTGKSEYFGTFHEIADEAYFRNVMLVSAVNNVPKPSFPSLYSSVFSVAAHDGTDPFGFEYNPSPPVEFGAPGIDLEVPWLDGSSIVATGNSFAAPHIAGLIARILGKHPSLTPFQVKTILCAVADNVTT
ncbi:MAG: S8 family serine peptidase [Actinobacteria bacterium]|nr:S8 family serine peptidase [Actinomycetota bacterium]MDQ3531815.1 S8 family serine peptidase [Actinomycetota bacterium]